MMCLGVLLAGSLQVPELAFARMVLEPVPQEVELSAPDQQAASHNSAEIENETSLDDEAPGKSPGVFYQNSYSQPVGETEVILPVLSACILHPPPKV